MSAADVIDFSPEVETPAPAEAEVETPVEETVEVPETDSEVVTPESTEESAEKKPEPKVDAKVDSKAVISDLIAKAKTSHATLQQLYSESTAEGKEKIKAVNAMIGEAVRTAQNA